MELKVKLLKWNAGLPVAMINQQTADLLGIHLGERISIRTLAKDPKELSTIVDIVKGMVKKNEIAFSSELNNVLRLRSKQKVDVNLAETPQSLFFIKRKLDGVRWSKKEIDSIIKDIVDNNLSEPEIALFISAMYNRGMTMKEITYLIDAIIKHGHKLKLRNKFIADKHSIGGIPGNRTTPIVVSICAAAGLTMPKTSSKAITSAAGTADVIETVAQIEFSIEELKKIVSKTNACMVWGGSLGMVPADSKIIKIEKQLKIDPEAQLLASIMAKKLAMGSDYILIDIPYGKNAKVGKERALRLKKKFEQLGKHFHKKLECVLTKGDEPIGNGVGPALEILDLVKVLDSAKEGPKDLEKKSLFLAGKLLEMTKKAKKGKGIEMAKEIITSGKAFKKFKEIIAAQKGHLNGLKPAKFTHDFIAKKSGKIYEIGNKKINSLARVAGCPIDKTSGLYLYKHVGQKVKKSEKILTVYAETKSRLNQAILFYKKTHPIKIR